MNFQIQIRYNDDQKCDEHLPWPISSLKKRSQGQNLMNKESDEKSSGKKNTKKRSYQWKMAQNRKYARFLNINAALFELSYLEKRKLKINVMMERYIKTRDSKQCHSHHQKMIQKYGSIQNIINNLSTQFPRKKNLDSQKVKNHFIEVQSQHLNGLKLLQSDSQKCLQTTESSEEDWCEFLEPLMFVQQERFE